jgi:flavin-dependent dehydrogenase
VRQAHGAGWALVGDAGSYLDPLSTHGITDALRDAETLARCVRTGTLDDLEEFAAIRAQVINATFDVVDRIAGYGWDIAQLRNHLLELSSAMSTELELVSGVNPDVGPRRA